MQNELIFEQIFIATDSRFVAYYKSKRISVVKNKHWEFSIDIEDMNYNILIEETKNFININAAVNYAVFLIDSYDIR